MPSSIQYFFITENLWQTLQHIKQVDIGNSFLRYTHYQFLPVRWKVYLGYFAAAVLEEFLYFINIYTILNEPGLKRISKAVKREHLVLLYF